MLREKQWVPEEGEFRTHWAFNQAVDMFEIECNTAVADYGTAADAINAFENWLLITGYVPEEPRLYTVKDYTITLSVPVQSGTVSFGCTFEPMPGTDLDEVIQKVKKDLAEKFNKNWKAPVANTNKPGAQKPSGNKKLKVHCVALRAQEKNDGRIFYYLMPDEGPWQTYGIPLYQGVAEEMNIELPEEAGEYEFEGMIVYETKEDSDKPKRVVGYAQ